MTKRRQEKGEVENDSPENEQLLLLDDISEISKESTCLPKKKRTKTRNNVSVTIEVMTRLDKENVQKLQRQRETLIAQGISESYPLQNSISPKLYDTIGQFLLLQDATDIEYDMEKENDIQKFAQRLQKSETIHSTEARLPKDHPEEIARREEMKSKRSNENNKRNNKRN